MDGPSHKDRFLGVMFSDMLPCLWRWRAGRRWLLSRPECLSEMMRVDPMDQASIATFVSTSRTRSA